MRTLLEVNVENFLSFRKQSATLSSLNVLVGPNGSGKTNFLRIFQFLGEVARLDLLPAIDLFSGYDQLRFRGSNQKNIKIGITGIVTENASISAQDEYRLSFSERRFEGGQGRTRRYVTRNESIVVKRTKGRGRRITLRGGRLTSAVDRAPSSPAVVGRQVSVQTSSSGLSMVRKLGEEYGASQVDALATVFEDLRLFEINVEKARQPSKSGDPSRLDADASNIAAYLEWLSSEHHNIFEKLCEDVRYILPSFESFRFTRLGGSQEAIRVDIKEHHLEDFTPMALVSFGTIRAISLFAMLLDPFPPKLTCLEEVDHGLHPHALDRLVERLRTASMNTQLIVATHSPALVNRLKPEELMVFEKDPGTGSTRIVDLSDKEIAQMKEVSGYELGELWFSGSLGGVL